MCCFCIHSIFCVLPAVVLLLVGETPLRLITTVFSDKANLGVCSWSSMSLGSVSPLQAARIQLDSGHLQIPSAQLADDLSWSWWEGYRPVLVAPLCKAKPWSDSRGQSPFTWYLLVHAPRCRLHKKAFTKSRADKWVGSKYKCKLVFEAVPACSWCEYIHDWV